jgi:hypothetical protein
MPVDIAAASLGARHVSGASGNSTNVCLGVPGGVDDGSNALSAKVPLWQELVFRLSFECRLASTTSSNQHPSRLTLCRLTYPDQTTAENIPYLPGTASHVSCLHWNRRLRAVATRHMALR